MVPFSHVLAFAAVVSVLIAIPGPSVLFTISRALTVGRRGALLTVVGNELGLCVQVVAVAFGVGAVVERWAQILTVVKFAGAAYLVFLGVQAIRHRTSMAEALAARLQPVPPLRAIRDGFVVGVANPKTIVFFVVGLPEFASSAPGHLPVPAQMLILGALFPVIALVLDSAWAAIAGTARRVVRPVAAAAGHDRRHRRPGDDRAGHQRRGNRPQGLAPGWPATSEADVRPSRNVTEDFLAGHPSERPPAAKHRRERRSGDRQWSRHPSRAGASPPVP